MSSAKAADRAVRASRRAATQASRTTTQATHSAKQASRAASRLTERPPRRTGATLVLGLGNPILGDDGIGWQVVAALRQMDLPPGVETDCLAVGGLRLMERLVGSDEAILVDAVSTGTAAPGSVMVVPLDDLPPRAAGHVDSSHDASLPAALAAARALGADVPETVLVVGVEIAPTGAFSEELTPAVAASVAHAAARVRDLVERRDGPAGRLC